MTKPSSTASAATHEPAVGPRRRRAIVLAAAAVLVSGLGYRWFDHTVSAALAAPVVLDPPLRSLPLVLGPWHGAEVPVSDGVLRIAGNDDYVSRTYRHAATGQSVALYIAYTARPRTMLRHRPSVCYPSAGWTSAGESQAVLELPPATTGDEADGDVAGAALSTTSAGAAARQLPVRIFEFYRPGLQEQRVAVLQYYVLAGVPTIDEHSFWSLGWRTPNLARDASRYVAQIQISAPVGPGGDAVASGTRRLLEQFAAETAGEILALLPASGGAE